jgi:hypothetical protein
VSAASPIGDHGRVDPRLRLAVDASRAWYDDVFALHGVPTDSDGRLWRALGDPPPYHSVVKTLQPAVSSSAVREAVHGPGAVADSFADLDLPDHTLLLEATWVHHPGRGPARRPVPPSWVVLRTARQLRLWGERHEYVGVLPPVVLQRQQFTVLGRYQGDELVGGAVLHDGSASVGLSNTWAADGRDTDWEELLAVAGSVHPDRSLTDYAGGVELEDMLRAGFHPVGTQRVWLPTAPPGPPGRPVSGPAAALPPPSRGPSARH